MTLYLIGIGLYDKKDISIKGLEIIKKCSVIYLEYYTSLLHNALDELSEYYGKNIVKADRAMVEQGCDEILERAENENVAFLVVGDVFGATTHTDLFLRAREKGVTVEVIHNASILNAVGLVGLELYKYGKTTSIVFPDNNWLSETSYDVIKMNKKNDLHTLCLLDIKIAEPSKEDLLRGKTDTPRPSRFMKIHEAIDVLLRIEKVRNEGIFSEDTLCIGVARLGAESKEQKIVVGKAKDLQKIDFGEPLHSLIIPGKLHHIEEEMLALWK